MKIEIEGTLGCLNIGMLSPVQSIFTALVTASQALINNPNGANSAHPHSEILPIGEKELPTP